ncbi:hypothetical protein SBA3_3150015 [Candidatus Sulfopaludibacter sp. SbA3]|nr:hypothetical protein SBA3_3150015 [Candidatus Sulfopaludibacter sp. SbA3]
MRVHVKIGAGGKVSDPQVLQGLGCGLDFQALKSVMEWQFRPGQLDGKAIAVVAWVEVSFRLP